MLRSMVSKIRIPLHLDYKYDYMFFVISNDYSH